MHRVLFLLWQHKFPWLVFCLSVLVREMLMGPFASWTRSLLRSLLFLGCGRLWCWKTVLGPEYSTLMAVWFLPERIASDFYYLLIQSLVWLIPRCSARNDQVRNTRLGILCSRLKISAVLYWIAGNQMKRALTSWFLRFSRLWRSPRP